MPTKYETAYTQLVREVMIEGEERKTRNAPTRATFGKMLVVDSLCHGEFPILQGRKLYPKGVFGEMAAFLKGPKTIKDFEDEGCNYWGKWGNEDGTINIDYGNLWLDFNGVDQLDSVLQSLATDPTGRRHVITGWKPDNIDNLSLPCCHLLYQWYVTNNGELEMIWYQRSVDTMIGLPSDVILAASWNIMMADYLKLIPGKLIFMLGDTHIYLSHTDQVHEYLNAATKTKDTGPSYFYEDDLYSFNKYSIKLLNYNPFNPITFELH